LNNVEGNQKYDLTLDIIGVSEKLDDEEMEMQAVSLKELGAPESETNIVLLGINKGLIFSTNPAELTGANKIIRLKAVK
jgi:hypothetical protein